MGLALDLAEAINILVGAALGESSESLRERLGNRSTQRRLARSIKDDLASLDVLGQVDLARLGRVLRSGGFIALVSDRPSAPGDDAHVSRELETALSGLDEDKRSLVVHRIRQLAVAALIRAASPSDQLALHMLRNVDEATLYLVELGRDTAEQLDRLQEQVEELNLYSVHATERVPAAMKDLAESSGARSLLRLTVQSVTRAFGEWAVPVTTDKELLEATANALDALIDDFEAVIEQILIVLLAADYEQFYGSGDRLPSWDLIAANRRLEAIARDAAIIAETLPHVADVQGPLSALVGITADIRVVENFLVIRVRGIVGPTVVMDDNLRSPEFFDDVGSETIIDLSRALEELATLRIDVRRRLADAISQL